MLDVLSVALFAIAVGQPQETTAQTPPSQATTPAEQQQVAAPQIPATPPEDERLVRECHREIATGSSLPRVVCRSRLRAALEHDIGQDIMEQVQGSSVERRRP